MKAGWKGIEQHFRSDYVKQLPLKSRRDFAEAFLLSIFQKWLTSIMTLPILLVFEPALMYKCIWYEKRYVVCIEWWFNSHIYILFLLG